MLILAQVTEAEVCGEGPDARWLCLMVFRSTENDVLARGAGGVATLLVILGIIVLAFIVARLLRRVVSRIAGRMEVRIEERLAQAVESGAITDTQKFRTRRLQRLKAITGVLRGVVATFVWLTALLWIIAELGIRLQPILAGAGLIGIIIGFGAQQLVRDVLAGIAMLIEDQYGVGDWIDVDGKIGQVERVGLRATSFRDLDGIQWHVLNGYIQRVGNLSQEWGRMTFDIPVALDTDVPTAKTLISRVAAELTHDPVWKDDIIGPHEIWGVQEFGPDGLAIRCVIPTRPMANWDIKRQMRERINHAFAETGIRQPGQLVDLGGRPDDGYPVATTEVAPEQARQPSPTTADHGTTPDEPAPPESGTGAADDDAQGEALPKPRRGRSPGRPPRRPAATPAEPESEAPGGAPLDRTTELPAPVRDETRELRIRRGSQPRPD